MNKLYKQYLAYRKCHLQVSSIHKIYFEEAGNPMGKPVVVLHGGPGSRSKPKYRRFFNPGKWRVIMFDQRGCGKSKPSGEIKNNTTTDLVEDTEKIRKYLKIKKWTVFGGSWGSTLGLAYIEKYPNTVSDIILRGIWLCRKKDIDWLMNGECIKRLFPDLWEWRVNAYKKLGIKEQNDFKALFQKLDSGTDKEKKMTVAIFENWEGQFSKIGKLARLVNPDNSDEKEKFANKILMHYIINNFFLKENELIENAYKFPKVPTVIIHGRYDVICPLDNAWELKKAIPHTEFKIVQLAGHNSSEKGTIDKIIEYTDKFSN